MVRVYYRAAHITHYWVLEIFQHFLPVCLAGVEMVIIFGFFAAIRLNTFTNENILVLVTSSVGVLGFIIFKRCFEFGFKITDSSRDFSRALVLRTGS